MLFISRHHGEKKFLAWHFVFEMSIKPQKCVCSWLVVVLFFFFFFERKGFTSILGGRVSTMAIKTWKYKLHEDRKVGSKKTKKDTVEKRMHSTCGWQITHKQAHTHTLGIDECALILTLQNVSLCVCCTCYVTRARHHHSSQSKSLSLTPISHSVSLWTTQRSTNKQTSTHQELSVTFVTGTLWLRATSSQLPKGT